MEDYEKKEFINDIMNFGNTFDDKTHKEFYNSTVKDFKSEVINNILGDVEVGEVDYSYENLMKYCEEGNIDPMDLIEWAFSMIGSLDDMQIQGQTIELSKSNDILSEMKEKFKQYKKSEDINNF